MRVFFVGLWLVFCAAAWADSAGDRAQHYLEDLLRLDTSNPPGNETRVAEYLRSVAVEEGIRCELLGATPGRLNFVARLASSGARRAPLLLMAHSDVVPADRSGWSVHPFSAIVRDGFVYGRGAEDDKSLLAAEMAALVELKRAAAPLRRDIILLSESDEEAGGAGIDWMVRNAWDRINAGFAINEGGFAMDLPSGTRVFHIQTAEKVPTRFILRAAGTAGHGSLPRPDNPVVRVSRALVALADADQPVHFNATSHRYFAEIARLPEYSWLAALIGKLSKKQTSLAAARSVRERDAELDAQLRTTIAPTVFHAGGSVNVIPNSAEALLDIRRLPDETSEEVLARMRRIVRDPAIEILPAPGPEIPATEPSPLSTDLYRAMETVFRRSAPRALVLPHMQRGATDGALLRSRGMPVYGIPLFLREDRDNRTHGNDERISLTNLRAGTSLLLEIVTTVAK